MNSTNHSLIDAWLDIGNRNYWIKDTYDPVFDERSFRECKSIEAVFNRIENGSWCVGTALYYRDADTGHYLCFIQQVEGGDEWLTIRNGTVFESVSFRHIIENSGRQAARGLVKKFLAATDHQLETLAY